MEIASEPMPCLKYTRRRGGRWSVLLMGMVLLWAVTAQAASFDCAKARIEVDKMICADAELSRLDEEMGRTFVSGQ